LSFIREEAQSPQDQSMTMPLLQSPVDAGVEARSGLRMTFPPVEDERSRQERERSRETKDRLRAEVARLAEENQALREAAAIWIRLYELQLSRANTATELLARFSELRAR
jgi:hypothetical protein